MIASMCLVVKLGRINDMTRRTDEANSRAQKNCFSSFPLLSTPI